MCLAGVRPWSRNIVVTGGLGLDYEGGKNAKKLLRNMWTTPKQKVVVEKEGTLSTMEKDYERA